jgi:NAD(P)H dehydrogenase (quinone)
VRNPDRVRDLAGRGVLVRLADYDRPETLEPAFKGAERLLLISSSAVGRRGPQHKAVIDAAARVGVGLMAYTSILHADTSPMGLAVEHRETEAYLRASGVPFVLLRNGWYTENNIGRVTAAAQSGVLAGCAGQGRIASAARADYAAAAAAVLTRDGQAGRVYELAGDAAYTLADLADETGRLAGRRVVYRHLTEVEYQEQLVAAGLPEGLAAMLADSDTGTSKGGLFDDGRQLSGLIGRPTASWIAMVQAAL